MKLMLRSLARVKISDVNEVNVEISGKSEVDVKISGVNEVSIDDSGQEWSYIPLS